MEQLSEEAFAVAEEWLTEARIREVENKILGSLRSYEFMGDLWSLHSFDQFRYLVAVGYELRKKTQPINIDGRKISEAWSEWLDTEEGKACWVGNAEGQYLLSRLERAFLAGVKFVEQQSQKE